MLFGVSGLLMMLWQGKARQPVSGVGSTSVALIRLIFLIIITMLLLLLLLIIIITMVDTVDNQWGQRAHAHFQR